MPRLPRSLPGALRRSLAGVLPGIVLASVVAANSLAATAPRTITRSRAAAVAAAISLRHSDVPTFEQQPNPQTAQERKLDAQASACGGGVPPSEAFANAQSPAFVSSGQPTVVIASSTEILPTAALVGHDVAAIEGPKALPCLVSELATELRSGLPKGDTLSGGKAGRLPTVVSSVARSFDIRITFTVVETNGKAKSSMPLYFDEIGFADGQAEVGLELQSTSVTSSTSLEERLAGLLVARAHTTLG